MCIFTGAKLVSCKLKEKRTNERRSDGDIDVTSKMPCWYYDKKDLRTTPSIRDGMDFETERRYRREGARFIHACGTQMLLGHNTIATGAVYFHRFYMFHTFQQFPRYVTACCCLFLAGKVEETPKKCRDIVATARTMLDDAAFQTFSMDARKAKEEVVTLESILLQTIKFDLEVEHPYNFLLTYAKSLRGDKVKMQKIVQMAWNFVNDSLSTTVCLQWEPEIIAVALIHLASKLSKFTVTDWVGRQPCHLRWWDMFISDVTMELLEDICHQVLDLYQQQPNGAAQQSPPTTAASSSSSASKTTSTSQSPIAATAKRSQTPPMNKPISPNVAAQALTTAAPPQMPTPAKLSNNEPPPPIPPFDYTTYQSTYGPMYSSVPPPPPPPPSMPMPNFPPYAFHNYNHPPPNRINGFYPTAP